MAVFVARQPIFDRDRNVYAYELLFRDGLDTAFAAIRDGTFATKQVMSNSVLLFGIETLTGGTKAFINVNREVLIEGLALLLPRHSVVPELVEDVGSDPEVIDACRKLARTGYEFALNDAAGVDPGDLLQLARFHKIDFLATDERRQKLLRERHQGESLKLIAKKIETYDDFERAMDIGYDYFQGFFFARPETLSRCDIPTGQQHYLCLLREINRPTLRFEELHNLIKQDMSLSYRLLTYLNSAHFAFHVEVRSIQHAMTLLGEREIKRWATLISMAHVGDGKPNELLISALTRARFLETLAPAVEMENEAQDLFLMGMLSLLDAIVDRPLADCLREMPLAKNIASALLGEPGRHHDMLELACAYELADWENLARAARRLKLSETRIPEIHLSSTRWSRETFAGSVSRSAARAPAT